MDYRLSKQSEFEAINFKGCHIKICQCSHKYVPFKTQEYLLNPKPKYIPEFSSRFSNPKNLLHILNPIYLLALQALKSLNVPKQKKSCNKRTVDGLGWSVCNSFSSDSRHVVHTCSLCWRRYYSKFYQNFVSKQQCGWQWSCFLCYYKFFEVFFSFFYKYRFKVFSKL